jgi:D-lyxose ketol-isomerase
VTPHPARADVLGLRNLTTVEWTATTDGGALHQVAPGKSVTLTPGLRINFGGRQGLVGS